MSDCLISNKQTNPITKSLTEFALLKTESDLVGKLISDQYSCLNQLYKCETPTLKEDKEDYVLETVKTPPQNVVRYEREIWMMDRVNDELQIINNSTSYSNTNITKKHQQKRQQLQHFAGSLI